MQFARLNGAVLHYQEIAGPEGAPVIVFVNSLGTDFRIWRDVIVRLVGEYAVLTYDKRGHGLSDIGEAPYDMALHVDDLAALLDHLGQKRVIVCGVSVGGMIAQGLAASRPDLVSALVLCDTAHKIGTPEMWDERVAAIRADGSLASIVDMVMERWFTPGFREPGNAAYDGYRNMFLRQPLDGYVGTCQAIGAADFTRSSAALDLPVICVVGDQDGSTPPDLVLSLARLIADAHYEVIAGAGHLPCIEQPEVLSDIIKTFIGKIGLEGMAHG